MGKISQKYSVGFLLSAGQSVSTNSRGSSKYEMSPVAHPTSQVVDNLHLKVPHDDIDYDILIEFWSAHALTSEYVLVVKFEALPFP